MSHRAVQAVLERTVLDAGFRARLFTRPEEALADYDLSTSETRALRSIRETASRPGRCVSVSIRRPLWTTGL